MGDVLSRILLVEDDEDIRETTRLILELDGFLVETCLSGRSAVEQAIAFQPDLIMLDVHMPDLDGPTTLGALKKNAATAGIPVVFLTASVLQQERTLLASLPALGIINKPYDPETLMAQLLTAWKNRPRPPG